MEMDVRQITLTVCSIVFAPILLLLSLVVFLAAIGKSFGIRRLYIKILLKVFEWGREKIHEREYTETPSLTTSTTEEGPSSNQKPLLNGGAVNGLQRENSSEKLLYDKNKKSAQDIRDDFHLSDVVYFCESGIQAIVEDEVTQRFSAEELPSWNLLTRTNTHHEFISYRLSILWFFGFLLRYFVLFPFRFVLAVFSVLCCAFCFALVGLIPYRGKFKRWLNYRVSVTCYRIMLRALSASVTFHNKENKAKGGGICVANHTSPIDIVILGCDNCYAMVGQSHGGFFGFLQRAFSRAEYHIWFHRNETKDRLAVANRLREHVKDETKLPILIFPEGTCINNTSIMMFKKGSFEVGGTIYPCAIKYDPRFADAFWNSSNHTLLRHIVMILTSWALVCDVWYLPPVTRQENESAIDFANRVKADIAEQGGLLDLQWDGQLKRNQPKASMKEKAQQEYSNLIKHDKSD